MTDLVERLREPIDPDYPDLWKVNKDRLNAADEIERLRAENEQLREALMDWPRDDGTAIAVGGEPGASAGKSE